MKRVLGLLVVVALGLIVSGCAVEKTYYYSMGGTTNGICEEIITNNGNIQSAATQAGFTEGTCASQGFNTSGHSCTFSSGSGSTTYDVVEYWGSAMSASIIQQACSAVGGTYR